MRDRCKQKSCVALTLTFYIILLCSSCDYTENFYLEILRSFKMLKKYRVDQTGGWMQNAHMSDLDLGQRQLKNFMQIVFIILNISTK